MNAQIEDRPKTDLPDTLDADVLHAFCEVCYPWQQMSLRPPDMVTGICGAVVLTATIPETDDIDDATTTPENACRSCVDSTVCTRGHEQG